MRAFCAFAITAFFAGSSIVQQPSSTNGATESTSTEHKPITRIRVGGPAAAALLISHPQPVYPEDARRKGVQGKVEMRAFISTEGSVQQVEVINGEPILRRAAIDAVSKWKYKPTLLNGEPVEVETLIVVTFSLKNKKN